MVGSIDPRCETVRGTHWPKKGREVVWSSRRGNHLGQRPKATASTGRTYGCKRSDQTLKKLLWHGGRPHMARGPSTYGSLRSQDDSVAHGHRLQKFQTRKNLFPETAPLTSRSSAQQRRGLITQPNWRCCPSSPAEVRRSLNPSGDQPCPSALHFC